MVVVVVAEAARHSKCEIFVTLRGVAVCDLILDSIQISVARLKCSSPTAGLCLTRSGSEESRIPPSPKHVCVAMAVTLRGVVVNRVTQHV